MAQAGKTFEVKFTGNTSNLSKAFQKLQGDAGGLGKAVSKSSGVMKTALAAVSVGGVVKGLQSAVMAASNLSESISKANVVFDKNAESVQNWSKTTAKAFGINRQAALEAAGTYGNLFRAFGLTEQQSYSMSTSLVELAADMASFNNTSVDDALMALRSGLSGETEPLKRYGVALTEVRLKEQAMSMGLIKTTKGTLPQAIKTQAAYALVMKDTALAQGDVSRTSEGLANQMKFLQAGLADAKAGFGEALLPAALSVVNAFNDKLLPAIQRVVEAVKLQGAGGGLKVLGTEIANVISNLQGAAKAVKDLILVFIGIKVVTPIILALRTAWISVTAAIGATATATQIAAGVMKSALISTGIGALVVVAGALVAKIIDMRIQAGATDKTITFMESNGVQAFRNMGDAAYLANQKIAGNIVTLNAVQLAATRASDALDNKGIMDVKRGRTGYFPVAVPNLDGSNTSGLTTGGGGVSKAAKKAADAAKKAADAMAKIVADASKRATAALEKMNVKLTEARDKLQAAKDAYKDFAGSVRDSISGLLNFGEAATAETGSFLENLRKQVTGVVGFADKVKQLITMGLSETGIQQVLAAGAQAGTKIADELISGGASAISETNALVASVSTAAEMLAKSGADQFYQAGITQGQAMVDGIITAIKKAGFIISGGMAALPKPLQTALDKGSLTTAQAKQLNGIIGNSQSVMAPNSTASSSAVINVTVNAGMGSDGQVIGREIVDAIKKYERVSGPVFASA